jgi:hypothetical protein
MPRSPFDEELLVDRSLPVPVSTVTPSPPLKAMTLSLAKLPLPWMRTPLPPLPRRVPSRLTPDVVQAQAVAVAGDPDAVAGEVGDDQARDERGEDRS